MISAGVKGLVICIRAGINDGNPHTRAGIAGHPGDVYPSHAHGHCHVGLCCLRLCRLRLIAGFQNHILHTGLAPNRLQLAIGHIGRDDVGSQGQIPLHIQRRTGHPGKLRDRIFLLSPELLPVGHGCWVFRHACRGESGFHRGFLLQHNGDTHQICVPMGCLLRRCILPLLRQRNADCAVICLAEANPFLPGSLDRRQPAP